MGNEIAQFREWDETREQDWDMLKYPMHDGFYHYMQKLMNLYRISPALYDGDYNSANFKWLEINAGDKVVYVYQRKTAKQHIIVALNFSNQTYEHLCFDVEEACVLKELLHSDHVIYGGESERKEKETLKSHRKGTHNWIETRLPAFTAIMWEVV